MLIPVFYFLKCVVIEIVFFNCCFQDNNISQGSVATPLRCGGIFSDGIIINVFLIQIVKYV